LHDWPHYYGEHRQPFTKGGRGKNSKAYSEILESDNDISFISSEKPSTEKMFPTVFNFTDSGQTSQLSTQSIYLDSKVNDLSRLDYFSSSSQESGRTSCSGSSQNLVKTLSLKNSISLKKPSYTVCNHNCDLNIPKTSDKCNLFTL